MAVDADEKREMTRVMRVQGSLFCGAAILLTLLSVWLPRLNPTAELLGVALLIVVLGVPHGALDPVIAKHEYRVNGSRAWCAFAAGYLCLMLGVIAVWARWPAVFLAGFLLITAVHFSGDPADGTSPISRVAFGGAIVILPCLLHAGEVSQLFGLLAGGESAALLVPILHRAAYGWAALLAVSGLWEWRRSRLVTLEFLALGAVAIVPSPLVGFTVFFCGMHGARHILRTVERTEGAAVGHLLKAAIAPMLLVTCAAGVVLMVAGTEPLELRVVRLMFVGLAALTVPHMLLVEPLRLRARRSGQSSLSPLGRA